MAPTSQDVQSTAAEKRPNILTYILHAITGGLIGLAELVPGVSGGTVALVMGIYERAIRNGDALLHAVRTLVSKPKELKAALAKVEWVFLLCVGVGMVGTVLAMSSVMHHFVESSPEIARALFLGMVALSLMVPLRMIPRTEFAAKREKLICAFSVAAVLTFFLTGISSAEKTDPSLIVIFFAAAFAVCALVLPGVSGSFLLLAMGLYSPVMAAVSDRDLTVMGVFILGAITGLALFIKLLNFFMTQHHAVTLATMAGLMLGSLRALWPWQDDSANLLAPSGNVAAIIGMVALGAAIVVGIMMLERIMGTKTEADYQ